jgi:hypothetical protein
MAHHIIEFQLESVDIKSFLETFWYSDDFYLNYMRDNLLDKDISIGEWKVPANEDGTSSRVRHVQSQHPCKVMPDTDTYAFISQYLAYTGMYIHMYQ